MKPYEAALKGSGEIAFTILSISISLVAVFIPLLLLGGIIGRLFREFAVTTTMCIAVSAFVALTLTPMMASRFLRSEKETKHGRFYEVTERGFDKMLHALSSGASTSCCATSSRRCACSSRRWRSPSISS